MARPHSSCVGITWEALEADATMGEAADKVHQARSNHWEIGNEQYLQKSVAIEFLGLSKSQEMRCSTLT